MVFLIVVVILYWNLSTRSRLWLVFLSSLLFYGFWRVEYLAVMLLSTFTDYFVALELGKTELSQKRKRFQLLLVSLVLNLGLLIYFKYLYFISENISHLASFMGMAVEMPEFNILLPLGISFYTFQTISYTVDAYRKHIEPEKNFALYGSYVTFFPQLVAGPVLRAQEVIGQLKVRPKFELSFIGQGLERILYGLFLKVVLADNIAPLVDAGYALPAASMSAIDVWTLAFIFGFQIYFDFAGYSHIAIGCAKLMGIQFPENFNFPYAATSFKSFWRRWHISLSSWIRDYLYLPLVGATVIDPSKRSQGGIDVSRLKTNISTTQKNKALFLTWAIMGLWHGANWTFVFWGIYHAVMIFMERQLTSFRKKTSLFQKAVVGWMVTLPLAMLGWVPFRAQSIGDTLTMFSKIINPTEYWAISMRENVYLVTFLLLLFTTMSYLYTTYLKNNVLENPWLRAPLQVGKFAMIFILVFTFFRPISQFIYFQF
ncbi:MAG: MBOAT family O-acyltransferase [Bacteroidota bacterium]